MDIHHLPVSKIPDGSVVLALGRRRSGKTVNIFTILNNKKDVFSCVLVFCGSAATRKQYESIVPKRFIYPEIDVPVLETLIEMQERAVEKKEAHKVAVIIDDCGFQSKVLRHRVFRRLLMNGRHYKIFFILSLQYSMGILPALRGQVDYVICSQEKSVQYRKRIYENYSIGFTTFKGFDRVFLACTQNFESFVIAVAASNSAKIEDNVFFFRSTFPIPSFRMVPAMWKSGSRKKEKEVKELRMEF